MAVSTVCYATREDVKGALDYKETARNNVQVDRAIEAASRSAEGLLRRTFYPQIATKYFDWPNDQHAFPWRIWLDGNELAAAATLVTSGGVTIPQSQIFYEPISYGPPYDRIELDRSTVAAFGVGKTPQRDVAITGQFGYSTDTAPAGALAAAITTTSATTATVTNSALVGVGDSLLIDAERLLVADKAMTTTSQTQQSGVTTAVASDVALGVTTGSAYFVGETLLLDSEKMLIVDIAANTLTVKRAWDGSVLATHSGATIFAPRLLTVTRGTLGTTAATHLNAAAVAKNLPPSPVKQLTLAYACSDLASETSAWAKVLGEGQGVGVTLGRSIPQLEKSVRSTYRRSGRSRAV
jgi:hypothetical protein